MSSAHRVLIVDDHAVFRFGLGALVDSVPELAVVGEAATGTEALAAMAALRPDVVVMDLSMPGGLDGVTATERIVRARRGVGVLVLTMFDDEDHMIAAMRAGARGYLLKTAGHEEIVLALRAVSAGQVIIGQPAAAKAQALFAGIAAPSRDQPPELTARERNVLSLIVRGEDNATIAQILVVSPKTVSNHITSIFRKLEVDNREQAIARARKYGLW